MTTVRETVDLLAQGKIPLYEAVNDLSRRDYVRERPSRAVRAGAEDPAPPDDDSIDWVELNPGLSEMQREHLRRAYDQAVA